ncbi:MAG: hypothetical protein KR126chlam5_00188 [Candidatus Anoxychlamydiales bacterium]|nr:hypothetical protein [Candidatus Anoxychlamydiales bacterium]
MIKYLALTIFSLLVFSSCSNSQDANNTTSRFYDDGRARPVVAISSVIDSTTYDLPWSLSEEITFLIKSQLTNNKNLFLSSTEMMDESLTNTDAPFDLNVNWMKDRFDNSEFLVFLELLNHNELKKDNISNLEMSMRIRIVDVRSREPKVILQECIDENYYIAKGSIKEDYQNVIWGSSEYANSRMGLAHKQLAKEISDRISDYIALSKSR